MRTGLPWRDLPSFFGVWILIYQQFNRWSSKNKLMDIFKVLVQDPDLKWEFIDGTIVKAHRHSAGAASADDVLGGIGLINMLWHSLDSEKSIPIDYRIDNKDTDGKTKNTHFYNMLKRV